MMTREQRDKIKARADAATAGPWIHRRKGQFPAEGGLYICRGWYPSSSPEEACVLTHLQASLEREPLDLEFIAHARQDVPALLADIKELDAQVERSKTAVHELLSGLRCRLDWVLREMRMTARSGPADQSKLAGWIAALTEICPTRELVAGTAPSEKEVTSDS